MQPRPHAAVLALAVLPALALAQEYYGFRYAFGVSC
jgi:hypothetical protein